MTDFVEEVKITEKREKKRTDFLITAGRSNG
jgi:hypothetical protein